MTNTVTEGQPPAAVEYPEDFEGLDEREIKSLKAAKLV
jgi:hypothetical protein